MAARVLVVDDHDAVRMMLVTVLDAAGYAARGAIDGADALEVLGRWRPDVILLDLAMPVMDGRRFLEQRATMPGVADIPVIVVTGATFRDVPSAEQLGVHAVLAKPHDVSSLRALIEGITRGAAVGTR